MTGLRKYILPEIKDASDDMIEKAYPIKNSGMQLLNYAMICSWWLSARLQ